MSQPPIEEQACGGAGPAPVPVQSLQYVMSQPGRPGMVTAIGVMSIVVASLSGFFGLISGLQTLGYYFMAMATSQATVAQARVMQTQAGVTQTSVMVYPAPATPGATAPTHLQRGMDATERDVAIAALTRMRPMTPARKRQLETILASAGKVIEPGYVHEIGTMPEMRSGESPPDYFLTATGRLEVYNDRAVFFPVDNTPTIRVSAPVDGSGGPAGEPVVVHEGASVGPSTTAVATGALSRAESQSVVQQAQAMGTNALNGAQANTLQALVESPGQQLVQPGGALGSVTSVLSQANGGVMVQFTNGGSVTLGQQGNVITMTTTPVMPVFNFSPAALGLSLAVSVATLGLAVFLLVAGIVTLRLSPRGRRLHLVYATLKIPLEVLGCVAAVWVAREFAAGINQGAGGAAFTTSYAIVTGLIPALLGLAYPVGLLIALNTKSIREYYSADKGV